MEKNFVTIGPVNKTSNILTNQLLKSLYPCKTKIIFTDNCLEKY